MSQHRWKRKLRFVPLLESSRPSPFWEWASFQEVPWPEISHVSMNGESSTLIAAMLMFGAGTIEFGLGPSGLIISTSFLPSLNHVCTSMLSVCRQMVSPDWISARRKRRNHRQREPLLGKAITSKRSHQNHQQHVQIYGEPQADGATKTTSRSSHGQGELLTGGAATTKGRHHQESIAGDALAG